jgi:uncharacterized membrane protein
LKGLTLLAKLVGLGIAGTGIAHFVKPELFEAITAPAFPDDTAAAIQQNGAIETAIGSAIFLGPTRKLGILGLLAYLGWLGYNGATAAKG